MWLYQRIFFGPVTNPKNEKLQDLTPREMAYFMPLVLLAFWIGLYPKPFFEILDQPVREVVEVVRPGTEPPVLSEATLEPARNRAALRLTWRRTAGELHAAILYQHRLRCFACP